MKKVIYMIFLVGSAVILGKGAGSLVAQTNGLSWLNSGSNISVSPGTFSFFDLFSITFGFSIEIKVAQLIFIAAAIIIYAKTVSKIIGK